MAVVVTAVPDPGFARIRLTVTGAANGPVSIMRLDANGSNLVRQAEGAASAGGSLLVDDYEAALRGDVTYTATDSALASGSRTVTNALAGVTGPWLTHPNLPALNQPVVIFDDDPTWAKRSTEHLVYGRAAPVYTTQPLQARTGTLTLHATSWDQVRTIHAVYERGNAVLLRQPCLTDADYYHVADVSTRPLSQGRWQGGWEVTIAYTAVDPPAGELQGSPDWTWDRVVANVATWDAVVAAYGTWADLVQGPAP
jgi:hypothetical protein